MDRGQQSSEKDLRREMPLRPWQQQELPRCGDYKMMQYFENGSLVSACYVREAQPSKNTIWDAVGWVLNAYNLAFAWTRWIYPSIGCAHSTMQAGLLHQQLNQCSLALPRSILIVLFWSSS